MGYIYKLMMASHINKSEIGILGAGIMGCCLALEPAKRGYRVDLIDRSFEPMIGASLHNEGKLNLGFVYANDPLKRTHGLMLRRYLAFSRIIKCEAGHP
ncbi:MAG: FAD-dependent oxidoreductase [Deltaproteobacteria bacterium]|nr:FAD-dependent oxidoreductase [Deltaproteobacteria bacterium]